MSVQINQIINANVYIDGNSQLGHAEDIKLPEITWTDVEHGNLGMVGKIKLPGIIEALEGEINWDGFYPEVLAKSYNPFKNVQLMIRSNLQKFNSAGLAEEVAMVTVLNVQFKKNPLGEYKPGDATKFSTSINVYSVKQTVAGQELLFFDAFSNQMRVASTDILAQYNANIGG